MQEITISKLQDFHSELDSLYWSLYTQFTDENPKASEESKMVLHAQMVLMRNIICTYQNMFANELQEEL